MNIANTEHSHNTQSSFWDFKVKLEEDAYGLLTPGIETPLFDSNSLALTTIVRSSNEPVFKSNAEWDYSCILGKDFKDPLHLVNVVDPGLQSPLNTPELDDFSDLDLIKKSIASLDLPKAPTQSLRASRNLGAYYRVKKEDDEQDFTNCDDDEDDDPTFDIGSDSHSYHNDSHKHRQTLISGTKSRGLVGRPSKYHSVNTHNVSRDQLPFKATRSHLNLSEKSRERVLKQLQRSVPTSSEICRTVELPTPSYASGVSGSQPGTFNFFNLRKKGAWRRKF